MDPTLFQLTHQNQIVVIITFPPMARSLSFFSNQLCIILSLLFALTTILQLGAIASAKPHERNTSSYARTLDRKLLGLNKKEKLTHFKIYWHDIVSGKNPTSVQVVTPTNNSLGFGMVSMIDNPLTQGPDMKSSKMVGKAQGFYALASQEEVGLLMVMNFAFMEGKYNGSCITVLGRNAVFSKVREMPVIGGTGLFRFARGYVQARTHWFDLKTKDAIVEYNVYVLHY